jgi:ankyrin repeat protein
MAPIHNAARNGNLIGVRAFLNSGTNVNARDNRGGTALIKAASFGRSAMVRLLLERGANTNGVLNRQRIRANIRNAIMKHKAGLTIAKHYKAATLRRRATAISSLRKHLPNNMVRTITSMRRGKY